MRTASCQCGAVTAACEGEPVRVSVCHCLDCQRRSGSAFAAQVRFPHERVTMTGTVCSWTRVGDSGTPADQIFCPICGSTVAYVARAVPDVVAIPIGAFADPHAFGPPAYSVYEERKFDWVAIDAAGTEHID